MSCVLAIRDAVAPHVHGAIFDFDVVPYFDEETELLFTSIEEGHLDAVQYFVSLGANIYGGYGWSLGLAAKCGHLEIVKYLASLDSDLINADDACALHEAIQEGHLEIVKYLVSVGADVNGCYIHNCLEVAILYERFEIAEYLKSVGAYKSRDIGHVT